MASANTFDLDDPDLQVAVLDALRTLSPDGETGPTYREWTHHKPDHLPSRDVVCRMFGGWRLAVQEAGLVPSRRIPTKRNQIRPLADLDRELMDSGWVPTDKWIPRPRAGDEDRDGGLVVGLDLIERGEKPYYDWLHQSTVPGIINVRRRPDGGVIVVQRTSTVYEIR